MQFFTRSNTILTGITYQALWLANLIHDVVAGIYAGCTTNAFHLHTIANVYAGRAHFYAGITINTITKIAHGIFLCNAPWFTTFIVISNNHRIFIKQYTLQSAVGANCGTNLFSKECIYTVKNSAEN